MSWRDLDDPSPFDMSAFRAWAKDMNDRVLDEFRRNEGRVSGGIPVLLLTHTGARSGKTYTTPLAYSRDGGRYVVIASMGGSPVNPQWFRNVARNPAVTLEVGRERFPARAQIPEEAERARLFAAQAAAYPSANFDGYAKFTARTIPVVAFQPLAPDS